MVNYTYKKKRWRSLARVVDQGGYFFRRPPPTKDLSPKKILVVRLDQLGDVVQTIPFFSSLKTSYPKAEIHALTTSAGKQILKLNNLADHILEWDCPWFDKQRKPSRSKKEVMEWIKKSQFDCVFELRGDVRLIAMLRLAGVKNLIGYGCTGGGFLLDVNVPWNPQVHAIDKNLALLESIGAKNIVLSSKIVPPKMGQTRELRSGKPVLRLAIHPDAGTPAKRWPKERFQEVISRLGHRQDMALELIGLNEKLGQELAEGNESFVNNRMGKTSLEELVQILAGCDGLLTNDSGPAHIMAMLGKPVWVLWSGTADPSVWAPRGNNIKLFVNPTPCAPCSLRQCNVQGHPCLTGIHPEGVCKTISEDLELVFNVHL